uniref:Uncharacterized protein n=1 Tax=Anguilla anguilla TaxID=7936 RepID=A0A0E9RCF8_ANGAN
MHAAKYSYIEAFDVLQEILLLLILLYFNGVDLSSFRSVSHV